MSASAPHLAGLPTETLEHVLLHLPVRDIIKMEAVNRCFRDLVHNSPILQHRRKLFATGLIDNPTNPCDLAQRRKLCEEYVHKWSESATIVKNTRKTPSNQLLCWSYAQSIGRNVLVLYPKLGNGLGFRYIPPVASQDPIETWSIPPFPFELFGLAVHYPENVLAVAERDGGLLRVHLLNLRDGSPHCSVAKSNTITWATPQSAPPITVGKFAITGSRIMADLFHSIVTDAALLPGTAQTMLVWDRKTGDLVLDLPTLDEEERNPVFLDEFRVLIVTPDAGTSTLELTVYNTLIPQDRPMSLRRFSLPQKYRNRDVLIRVDGDRPLGTLNKGDPFITDPTQAIFIVEISKSHHQPTVLLVVRIQDLIEHVCSTCTDVRIPWDEWGRGAVIVENQVFGYSPSIYVHDTHLVLFEYSHGFGTGDCLRVRIFDFSRRGCSALPLCLWDVEGSGARRKALFSDGRKSVSERFDAAGAGSLSQMGSLGNGNFFRLMLIGNGDIVLDFWELT